jgi:hypothetical protein
MIWEAKCKATRHVRVNRVLPSALQFRFLGRKGVVAVDHRPQGIEMCCSREFTVHDVDEAEFSSKEPASLTIQIRSI